MADDDFRYYETYYGIETDDWEETYPGFANHHKFLVKEYISEGCSCTSNSQATDTNEFLYPHYIKDIYFIEGVIMGHVTFGAGGCTSHITSYRLTVCKVHEDTTKTELFSTGWVTVNDDLDWDSGIGSGVGEDVVYPFWIDAWDYQELNRNERIYVKVETDSDNCCILWHSNDSTWEDLRVEIPFRM